MKRHPADTVIEYLLLAVILAMGLLLWQVLDRECFCFTKKEYSSTTTQLIKVARGEIKKARYWENVWRDNYEQLDKMKCTHWRDYIDLLKESEQTYKNLWKTRCILRTSHICAGKAGGIAFTGTANGPNCVKRKNSTWDIVWVDRSAKDKDGKPVTFCIGQARRPKAGWVEK